MDYLFDDVLLYRSDDGVLLPVGENDDNVITLTPVLNRMLILLIEKKGQLVTREEFLEKVWDNHGRIASSNTLTQYISTLRKIFSDHLKKECVVTLPKRGYMLSADVNVVALSRPDAGLIEVDVEPESSNDAPLSESVKEHNDERPAGKTISKRMIKITLALLTITSVAAVLYFLLFEQINSDKKVLAAGSIDHCQIFFLPDYNARMKVKSDIDMDRVKKHIKQFDLNCIDGAEFFFYKNNTTGLPVNIYSLLSRCVKDSDSHDECVTTKISGQ
ncbi:transcriptional regulator [Serratia sp. UGAL515B_01]|uniref:winged helix-turn-helix domain-containing protein n=1 Tax=Serratia sp. UGAL515B_01 TaxID=2986763 RepID=UPI002955C934|nr:winged helix-turn-helix domain-containing protein [Serratia sp. UGAL515B_01]WON76451.1 winged helix-turn-helix domain-containing protein [Serratia sp. UGAL515B_01]